MSAITKNFPTIRNGSQMISFMTGKDVSKYFDGSLDNASLEMWYQEDPMNRHLGLMNYWNKIERNKPVTIFDNLLSSRSVIEVNGENGFFTWDVNVEKDTGYYVEQDTSYQNNAGIDGSIFYIILNKEFAPGTTLTYDLDDGVQLRVAETDEEVQPLGTGFKHPVQIVSNDKRATYPTKFLTKGTQFFPVSHTTPEYGTKFAKVQLPDTPDTKRFIFRLGDVTGVEGWVTSTAGRKSLSAGVITAGTEEYKNKIEADIDKYGFGEFAVRMDVDSAGNPNLNTANVGTTMEFLVKKEFHQLMGSKLMFQRAADIRTGNGVVHINEGLWPQIQRGFTIEYGRAGGITRTHISDAVEYVFRNSDLPINERRITFKCGTQAYYNGLDLFKDEISRQVAALAPFLGSERLIPNPVSGSLDSLSLAPVTFNEVFLPQIGWVKFELDTSLDHGPQGDRFSKGMHPGGTNWTTYSMIIWDASSPDYSNRAQGLPNGTNLVEGGNGRANVFLVKPQGDMVYSGTETGRYSAYQSRDIVSSGKYRSQGHFVYGNMDVWIRDTTKLVIIQLDKHARKGLY